MEQKSAQGTQSLAITDAHRNEQFRLPFYVYGRDPNGARVPIDVSDATAASYVVTQVNAGGKVLHESTLGDGITIVDDLVTVEFNSNFKNVTGAAWHRFTITRPEWGVRTIFEGPFTIVI